MIDIGSLELVKRNLVTDIDATGSIEEIFERLLKAAK